MEDNNNSDNNKNKNADEKAKDRSRRTVPATSPGAVPSTPRSPDQDAISKSRARRMVSATPSPGATAVVPGAVAAQPLPENDPGMVSHLEADAMAKARARAGVGAMARSGGSQRAKRSPRPGVVAATGGTQHGKASGRSAMQSSAARTNSQHAVGVSDETKRETLRAMEDDLIAKTSAVGAVASTVDPAARKAARQSSRALRGVGGDEVVEPGDTSAAPVSETLSNIRDLEANLLSKQPLQGDIIPETSGDDYVEEPPSEDFGEVGAVAYEPAVVGAEESDVVEPAAGGDEVYPGAVQPSDAEGIEAFVTSPVVDATGVVVVMSDEDEEKMEQRKCRRWLLYGGIAFVLIVSVVVVVVLVIPQGGDPEPLVPTATPSISPSGTPSAAPTSSRLNAVIGHVTPVSGSEVFLDFESPQYRAAVWLADVDPLSLPVSQSTPQLLQRYSLAVLYYTMNGDMWLSCFTTDVSCPSGQNWLTQGECSWFGLTCVGADVTRLSGKSNIVCCFVGCLPNFDLAKLLSSEMVSSEVFLLKLAC